MKNNYHTVFLLTFLFFSQASIAQTHVWTGNGGDSNWFNTLNWDVSAVPDSSSEVFIPDGFNVDITSAPAAALSIELNGASQLVLENDLLLSGTLNIPLVSEFIFRSGLLHGGAIVDNEGTMRLEGQTNREFSNITVNNEGLFLVTNANQTFVTNNTLINNSSSGTIDIASVGGFLQQTSNATLINQGLLRKSFDGVSPTGNFYLILEIINSGVIEVPENEMLLFLAGSSDFINQPSGLIKGAGILDITANFVNLGTISPGEQNEAATMTVVNNFNLDPAGVLYLDIFGTQSGEYDFVDATGSPILDGNLYINMPQGSANIGDEYTVITSTNPFFACNFPDQIVANNGETNDYILDVICESNSLTLRVADVLLSNKDFRADAFLISPNPASEVVKISMNPIIIGKDPMLQIIDVSGRLIRSIAVELESFSLNISEFQGGMYFLQLTTENRILSTQKLIVR